MFGLVYRSGKPKILIKIVFNVQQNHSDYSEKLMIASIYQASIFYNENGVDYEVENEKKTKDNLSGFG